MKFNWGTGIFIFLILFVSLGIAFMVFAFNQEISLVHENYYEKGLNFDEEIAIKNRSVNYINLVNVETQNNLINISFDSSIKNSCTDIKVHFYSPAEHNNDYKAIFNNLSNGISIDKSNINNGRYIVNIYWTMNNEVYKVEKEYRIK